MLCNLKLKHSPPRSIIIKLHGILTPRLKLELGNVWGITRSRKEGAYIWSIWHKAVGVNAWRARLYRTLKTNITCGWLIPHKPSHIDFEIASLPKEHGTFPLVSSTPWKHNLDKRDLGGLWIGNTRSLARNFLPHLAKLLECGCYWHVLP
jgi:hypothetical protein